jgi:membrane protease YdiL (CAAX protease family)
VENHSEEEVVNSNQAGETDSKSIIQLSPLQRYWFIALELPVVVLLQVALSVISISVFKFDLAVASSIAATGILIYYLVRQPIINSFNPVQKAYLSLPLKENILLIIQGALLSLLVLFSYSFFIELIGYTPKPQNVDAILRPKEIISGSVSLTATYLMVVYSAPLWEEIAFRGILQDSLQKTLSASQAIIISGLLFSLIHIDFDQFIPLTLLGCIFGWMYHRSGSIFPSVIAHSLVNNLGIYTKLIQEFEKL